MDLFPVVIPMSGTLVGFLFPPTVPGGPGQVLADRANEPFALQPPPGRTRDFPTVDILRTIVSTNRSGFDEYSAEHRDALGRNVNNLAAQQLLLLQEEALDGFHEAEEHFIAIVGFFPRPSPRALIGLAAARFNIAVVDSMLGDYERAADVMRRTRETIDAIPSEERHAGYDFFDQALKSAAAAQARLRRQL